VLLYSASPLEATRPGQRPVPVAGQDAGRQVPAGMIAVPVDRLCAGVATIAGAEQGAVTVAGGGLVGGQLAVFAAPVVTAPVVRRRDGRVQADGHPGDYARLMLLEDQLPAGLIEDLVARYTVKEKRRRGLTAAMAVRCVLMMVLQPNASQREVMAAVAGQLADVPWARPWQVPGGEVPSRHRTQLGSAMFRDLFTVVARRNAADADRLRPPPVVADRSAAGWLGDLLLCSGDGILTRVADGDNRETFGSPGTSDDSSPFPQIRAVVITVCATRALLGAAVAACETGEQTLTRQILTEQTWAFAAGRLYLFDRNFLGATLIEQILKAKAHLLMRMKAGIDLPNLGWLPDGSYRSRLRLPDGRTIPVRVVDYDVIPPGDVVTSGELFCLVTDLLDHQAYPADALAAAYPWRWNGSETTFKENKSTITDAGPSRGPILRSRTPDLVRQEFWAWLTATDLTRSAGRAAAALPLPATPTRPVRPLPARAVSFTATLREVIRCTTQTYESIKDKVARTPRAQRIQLDRHRHRPRVTKARQTFPNAKPATMTVTGTAALLVRAVHPVPGGL
jgi:hypothetical protein